MSKTGRAVIVTVIALVFVVPVVVLIYGSLFGHSYTESQLLAGGFCLFVGIFLSMVTTFLWDDIN